MKNIADISEVLLRAGLFSVVTEEERALAGEFLKFSQAAVRRYLGYDPVQGTRTEYYPNLDIELGGRRIWEVNDTQAYTRTVGEATATELQIRHVPIRSITSLYVDYDGRAGARSGAFPAGSQWTEGTDFWPNYDSVDSSSAKVCRDGILRSYGLWPTNPGSVKITYVAGYTDAELHGQDSVIDASVIVDVVIDEAVRRFIKFDAMKKKSGAGFTGPLSSESLGDYSYSVDTSSRNELISKSDLTMESISKLDDFVNYGWRMMS